MMMLLNLYAINNKSENICKPPNMQESWSCSLHRNGPHLKDLPQGNFQTTTSNPVNVAGLHPGRRHLASGVPDWIFQNP